MSSTYQPHEAPRLWTYTVDEFGLSILKRFEVGDLVLAVSSSKNYLINGSMSQPCVIEKIDRINLHMGHTAFDFQLRPKVMTEEEQKQLNIHMSTLYSPNDLYPAIKNGNATLYGPKGRDIESYGALKCTIAEPEPDPDFWAKARQTLERETSQ